MPCLRPGSPLYLGTKHRLHRLAVPPAGCHAVQDFMRPRSAEGAPINPAVDKCDTSGAGIRGKIPLRLPAAVRCHIGRESMIACGGAGDGVGRESMIVRGGAGDGVAHELVPLGLMSSGQSVRPGAILSGHQTMSTIFAEMFWLPISGARCQSRES